MIEIFFEKRKKIKKGNSRKRKRKIVHSESFYSKIRTEIRVMHCTRVGGKWLERTPFSCPHIDSEKTKEMKRKRKKIRKNNWFSPKSNFLFNSIDWVRVSTKILGGKRAATGNCTCIVSYHNPEYTPCQRLRASAINGQASKRNLRAKETRRKGERGKEKDIYTYVCIYIYVYIHTKARNHGLGKLQDRVPTGINQGRKEEEEERWEEAIRIPRTHGHAFNQSSSPIFDICNL